MSRIAENPSMQLLHGEQVSLTYKTCQGCVPASYGRPQKGLGLVVPYE